MTDTTHFWDILLNLAHEAATQGEVPVAAMVVCEGEVLAQAVNRVERDCDPSAHAEILALRAASEKLKSPRLVGCDLLVTLEPCPMCAQAISFARINRLYYGAYDPKGGGVDHGARIFEQPSCHHVPQLVSGVEEAACGKLLRDFFANRR